ncbi:hypothetical protein IKF63_02820 [Candidatus Saccharibacteria bacterium]|nr:hypothetical protein [Candidatus Saccharibacteria bacterium]
MGGKNIKSVKRSLYRLKAIKTWQLFLVFILFVFASATLLRIDHIKMTTLRSEVLSADEEGNTELLSEKLNELRNFTRKHIVINVVDDNGIKKMEFGTGVFYLENSYIRDATAIINQASEQEIDDSNPNGNIYAAASAVCRPLAIANGWAWNSQGYLNCFTNELAKYPASALSEENISVTIPSTELYRHEFLSPIWAPCLSGFVILVTAVIGVVIFIRFLIWLVLEITLIILKNP